MQLNKLYQCFLLWIIVGFVSVCVGSFHRYRITQGQKLKENYIYRLLEFAANVTSVDELMWELYYSYSNNKKIQSLILKAIQVKDSTPGMDNIMKCFHIIEKKMSNDVIKYVHGEIIRSENEFGDLKMLDVDNLKSESVDRIELWKSRSNEFFRIMKKQRFKLLIEKIIFLIGNMAIFYKYRSDVNMAVVIIVNTIGLICFIVQDYDCHIENQKKREGNLAYKKLLMKGQKKTQTFQIIGGLGLIVSVTQIIARFLEQAI